jgi:hypothetical protein
METKPLPALESTGQAETNAMPDDMANAASEPMAEPDSSSDDVPAEDHSADPA